jgi:prepilin-type N-terminal cleavage/methylation domain-containing protein
MRPISAPDGRPIRTNHDRLRDQRAGFTLLEVLLAIAIMSLTVALILPNVFATQEHNKADRAFFHFRRMTLDLRATAFHEERPLVLVDTGKFVEDDDAEPAVAEIKLDDGWSYHLSAPMNISAGGVCDQVTAELSQAGQIRMRLTGDAACAFTRVTT